eukprot:2798476-Pyramimonas_sp.AAC.1
MTTTRDDCEDGRRRREDEDDDPTTTQTIATTTTTTTTTELLHAADRLAVDAVRGYHVEPRALPSVVGLAARVLALLRKSGR